MRFDGFPIGITDWSRIPATQRPGDRGTASWRTKTFGLIRAHMVEYSAGYLSLRWSEQGILLCMAGELHLHLHDGRELTMHTGISYEIVDNSRSQLAFTGMGALLFIIE